MKTPEIPVPTTMYEVKVEDKTFSETYLSTWEDYSFAALKLSKLMMSYKTQEKFVEDFPEFDKYLPKKNMVSALPAIIVKDVRNELAKLGIPAKV